MYICTRKLIKIGGYINWKETSKYFLNGFYMIYNKTTGIAVAHGSIPFRYQSFESIQAVNRFELIWQAILCPQSYKLETVNTESNLIWSVVSKVIRITR